MIQIELPKWFGKHDNPHHSGMISHLKKIANCNDELEEYTGIKKKHIKISQREIRKEISEALTKSQ
jgi:hypothetical protein